LVSPADGKVICVDEAEDPCFGQGKFRRVGIFLSVLDVHVNRSPYAGTFEKTHYSAGEFLDARHMEVDLRNENQTWWLKTSRGTVLVRQIAGLIARRIVGWKKPGDPVQTGERFGMIRFGSRTDLYFPASCTPKVQPGQRVVGGETVIATWPA
jgi:phosphatidylserine decarboxylase